MQSTNGRRWHIGATQVASTARWPGEASATPNAAMTGSVALALLVLLFLVSTAFVVFGGAYESASTPEAAISMAADALQPGSAGGAARGDKLPRSSAEPDGYFPAAYANRGRDGDGNVMTYEHD
jgi:hypothetical protein